MNTGATPGLRELMNSDDGAMRLRRRWRMYRNKPSATHERNTTPPTTPPTIAPVLDDEELLEDGS